MSNLNEGQKLSFDIEADRKNGKSAAANLQANDRRQSQATACRAGSAIQHI